MKKILSLGLLVLVVAGFGAGCRTTDNGSNGGGNSGGGNSGGGATGGGGTNSGAATSLLDLPVGQFLR